MATHEQKYSVSVRYVIQWMFVEGCCLRTKCLTHTTMVNTKINFPHFPLIQKSASRGAKTHRRERSIEKKPFEPKLFLKIPFALRSE